jgi:hypothetical protein
MKISIKKLIYKKFININIFKHIKMEEQNEKVNLEEVLKRLSLLEKQNAVFVEKEKIQKILTHV